MIHIKISILKCLTNINFISLSVFLLLMSFLILIFHHIKRLRTSPLSCKLKTCKLPKLSCFFLYKLNVFTSVLCFVWMFSQRLKLKTSFLVSLFYIKITDYILINTLHTFNFHFLSYLFRTSQPAADGKIVGSLLLVI